MKQSTTFGERVDSGEKKVVKKSSSRGLVHRAMTISDSARAFLKGDATPPRTSPSPGTREKSRDRVHKDSDKKDGGTDVKEAHGEEGKIELATNINTAAIEAADIVSSTERTDNKCEDNEKTQDKGKAEDVASETSPRTAERESKERKGRTKRTTRTESVKHSRNRGDSPSSPRRDSPKIRPNSPRSKILTEATNSKGSQEARDIPDMTAAALVIVGDAEGVDGSKATKDNQDKEAKEVDIRETKREYKYSREGSKTIKDSLDANSKSRNRECSKERDREACLKNTTPREDRNEEGIEVARKVKGTSSLRPSTSNLVIDTLELRLERPNLIPKTMDMVH